MRQINKLLKNVLLLLASLMATGLIIEGCFRFFDIRPADIGATTYNNSQSLQYTPYPGYTGNNKSYSWYKYKPNSTWSTQYPSNERRYFDSNNQIEYTINSDGFRDYQFGPKKPGIFRIVVIGDSYALGEGVKLEDCFSKVLEKKLREKNNNIEVYNLGVNGYDIRDELAILQNNLDLFKPDMVIWGYVLNDISRPAFGLWPAEMKKIKKAIFVKSTSYLLKFIQHRLWKMYYSKQYVRFVLDTYNNQEYWNDVTVLFRQALRTIQASDASMIVLVFPDLNALSRKKYSFESIHNKLSKFLQAERVHFIDFSDVYKMYGPLKLRVHTIDAHPNEIGHRIVAEKIMQDRVFIDNLK